MASKKARCPVDVYGDQCTKDAGHEGRHSTLPYVSVEYQRTPWHFFLALGVLWALAVSCSVMLLLMVS